MHGTLGASAWLPLNLGAGWATSAHDSYGGKHPEAGPSSSSAHGSRQSKDEMGAHRGGGEVAEGHGLAVCYGMVGIKARWRGMDELRSSTQQATDVQVGCEGTGAEEELRLPIASCPGVSANGTGAVVRRGGLDASGSGSFSVAPAQPGRGMGY